MEHGDKSYHSICAWTFNGGKGGFTPSDSRPQWARVEFDSVAKIELIAEKITPRLPKHIHTGIELHYDYEYDEYTAEKITRTLQSCEISLAMVTPGAHRHFAYGGICSPDPRERSAAAKFSKSALTIAYEKTRSAWNGDVPPSFVIWNGSFGYDLATPVILEMYNNLKKHVAELCTLEAQLGGKLHIAIEPKPNEGHAAMLLPTVASSIAFWYRLQKEFGIDLSRKGINKEFGHSEMIGLDHVYDTVEEIDNGMLMHMHINSQGYNDGLILGGPGKFDIDNGARINGMNIAIAHLIGQAGYNRWRGHDMQVRPYDDEEQGIERVIRSILSWDACEQAARTLDYESISNLMAQRKTAEAEDLMRHAVQRAWSLFDEMYQR